MQFSVLDNALYKEWSVLFIYNKKYHHINLELHVYGKIPTFKINKTPKWRKILSFPSV